MSILKYLEKDILSKSYLPQSKYLQRSAPQVSSQEKQTVTLMEKKQVKAGERGREFPEVDLSGFTVSSERQKKIEQNKS